MTSTHRAGAASRMVGYALLLALFLLGVMALLPMRAGAAEVTGAASATPTPTPTSLSTTPTPTPPTPATPSATPTAPSAQGNATTNPVTDAATVAAPPTDRSAAPLTAGQPPLGATPDAQPAPTAEVAPAAQPGAPTGAQPTASAAPPPEAAPTAAPLTAGQPARQPVSPPVKGQFASYAQGQATQQLQGVPPTPTTLRLPPRDDRFAPLDVPDPIQGAIRSTGVFDSTVNLSVGASGNGLDTQGLIPLSPGGGQAGPITAQQPQPTTTATAEPATPQGGIVVTVPDSQTRMFLVPLPPEPTPANCQGGCPEPATRWQVQIQPGLRPEDQYDPRATAGIGPTGQSPGGTPAPDAGERGIDQLQPPPEGAGMVLVVPVPASQLQPAQGEPAPDDYAVLQLVYRGGQWVPVAGTAAGKPPDVAKELAYNLSEEVPGSRIVELPPRGSEDGKGPTQTWFGLTPSEEIKGVLRGEGVADAIAALSTPRGFVFTGFGMVSTFLNRYPSYLVKGYTPQQALVRTFEYMVGSTERDATERVTLDYPFVDGAVTNAAIKGLINTGSFLTIEGVNTLATKLLASNEARVAANQAVAEAAAAATDKGLLAQLNVLKLRLAALPVGRVQQAVGPLRDWLGETSGPVRLADKFKGTDLRIGLSPWYNMPLQAALIYLVSDVGTPGMRKLGVLDQPIGYDEHGQPQFASRSAYYQWLIWEGTMVNGAPAYLFGLDDLWEKPPAPGPVPAAAGEAAAAELATAAAPTVAKVITPASFRMAVKTGLLGFGTLMLLSVGSNFFANPPPGPGLDHDVAVSVGRQIAALDRLRLHPDPASFGELSRSAQLNDDLGTLQYGLEYFDRNLLGATSGFFAALALPRKVIELGQSAKIVVWDGPHELYAWATGDTATVDEIDAMIKAHNEKLARGVSADTEASYNAAQARAESFRQQAMAMPVPEGKRDQLEYWRLNVSEWLGTYMDEQGAIWGTLDKPPDPLQALRARLRRQAAWDRAGNAWSALWGGTPAPWPAPTGPPLAPAPGPVTPTPVPTLSDDQVQRNMDQLRATMEAAPTPGTTPTP